MKTGSLFLPHRVERASKVQEILPKQTPPKLRANLRDRRRGDTSDSIPSQ